MIKERHSRNIPALSEADMGILADSHVLIAGCGGIGGNVIESLARIGIGAITVVDGDSFDESNLNRQILCTPDKLGSSKALAAADRIRLIDPSICVTAVCEPVTAANASSLMEGIDLVIDALDSVGSRLMLEDAASDAGLFMVHGAISGWDLQAMLVPPGSGLLHTLYEGTPESDVKTSLPMTPAACAAIEVSLAVRYLCGHDVPAPGTLYAGSLRDMQYGAIALTTGDE